jgi:hypothetical protein
MLKSLNQNVFHLVNHFHQSHLNQFHSWHELNRVHFHLHHFIWFWFQGMLKFFVQNVFQIANHFHQSHLNQINTWHESNRMRFINLRLRSFWFLRQSVYRIWCNWHCFTNQTCWWGFLSWVWSMTPAEVIGYWNWFSTNSEGGFQCLVFGRLHCQSFRIWRKINELWVKWNLKSNISSDWKMNF